MGAYTLAKTRHPCFLFWRNNSGQLIYSSQWACGRESGNALLIQVRRQEGKWQRLWKFASSKQTRKLSHSCDSLRQNFGWKFNLVPKLKGEHYCFLDIYNMFKVKMINYFFTSSCREGCHFAQQYELASHWIWNFYKSENLFVGVAISFNSSLASSTFYSPFLNLNFSYFLLWFTHDTQKCLLKWNFRYFGNVLMIYSLWGWIILKGKDAKSWSHFPRMSHLLTSFPWARRISSQNKNLEEQRGQGQRKPNEGLSTGEQLIFNLCCSQVKGR